MTLFQFGCGTEPGLWEKLLYSTFAFTQLKLTLNYHKYRLICPSLSLALRIIACFSVTIEDKTDRERPNTVPSCDVFASSSQFHEHTELNRDQHAQGHHTTPLFKQPVRTPETVPTTKRGHHTPAPVRSYHTQLDPRRTIRSPAHARAALCGTEPAL